ncbi:MAG: hypothetical protein R3F27_12410 [Gammaproteobacteria bacterium]
MSFLQTITIGTAASGIEAVTAYENTIGWLATASACWQRCRCCRPWNG